MRKAFLVLLVIACLAAAAYTGYLLYTRQTEPIVGGVILLIDIGVLVWNISILRRYRVSFGTVFTIFLLTALLVSTVGAFAGVAPLADAKDRVVTILGDLRLGISSELETTIIGFVAQRTPPDISRAVFLVDLDKTEKTVKGVEYLVELLLDDQVCDSAKVVITRTGSMTGSIDLEGHGQVMNKMLSELDERYEAAKLRYEEYKEEADWRALWEGKMFDYDWVKQTEAKLQRLATERDKWKTLRNGGPFSDSDLHDFCSRYVKLRVTRDEVSP